MIYELRTYTAAPGRAPHLHRRFAEGTLDIFSRLGIEVVGFFTEVEDPERLVYLVRFPDEETRRAAWAAFAEDEEWLELKASSEVDGPLVADMAKTVLQPTTYAPVR